MSKRHRLSWNEIQRYQQDQPNTIMSFIEQYGPVAELNMLGVNLTFIAEPGIIQKLLIKHANQLHRDPFTHRVFKRMVGDGLFVAEDRPWRRKRKLMQPIFRATHIQDFADSFAQHTQKLIGRWRVGDTVQLDHEMMELALRIICKTMFGAKIDDLVPKISELMHTTMAEAESQLRPPVPDWFPTFGMVRQRKSVNALRGLLLEIIQARQAEIAKGETGQHDLLTMLLTAKDEDGEPLSDVEVLDECLTIFVAGHETTAVAMTWTWLLLLLHPPIFGRLQDEVEQVFGNGPVQYDRLKEIPFLEQVVKESLRMYPPASGFGRTPIEPFTIDGYEFKKGDIVIVSNYVLQRQDRFFPDPHTFKPGRFAADQPQPPRYAYLPFGAGSRTCIGNAFATLEMQVILATMVQQVELSLVPDQDFTPEMQVTLRPKNGVKVRVEKKIEAGEGLGKQAAGMVSAQRI